MREGGMDGVGEVGEEDGWEGGRITASMPPHPLISHPNTLPISWPGVHVGVWGYIERCHKKYKT